MVEARDEYFSKQDQFSLGIDDESGRPYVSIPVTIGVADYEEFYAVDREQYARFLANPELALPFVEECRRREHDDLLLEQPGWNRGIPI
ncbi:MAG: hypothetical protein ABIP33_02655 [Pseudolysinimonas sp.]